MPPCQRKVLNSQATLRVVRMLHESPCMADMNLNGARLAVAAALTCLAVGFAAGAWWAGSSRVTPAVSEAAGDPPRVAEFAQTNAPSSPPAPPASLPPAADPGMPSASQVIASGSGDGQLAMQLAAAQAAEGVPQVPSDATGPIDQRTAQPAGAMPSDVVAAPPSQNDGGLNQLSAQQGGGS
jgi:hypothetical protein